MKTRDVHGHGGILDYYLIFEYAPTGIEIIEKVLYVF